MPRISHKVIRTHLSLFESRYKLLTKIAKENNTTTSNMIRILIETFLENYEENNPPNTNTNTNPNPPNPNPSKLDFNQLSF